MYYHILRDCSCAYCSVSLCACVIVQMAPIGYALFTLSSVLNAIGSSLTLRLKLVKHYIHTELNCWLLFHAECIRYVNMYSNSTACPEK